jgi:hypothetical protein
MIEVMVALMLTAVGTAGLLALYSVQTRASGYTRHAIEATQLAQDQIERLLTTAVPGSVTTGSQQHLDERGAVTTSGLFTRTWTVTPQTEHCDLIVTVSWSEDGMARQVVVRGKRSL